MKSEINKTLKACQQNLKDLGSKRQTTAEQSQYLMGIAMEFQKLSTEALLSNYGRTDVFDLKPTLRLATAVVNRSDQMSETIATKGHTFRFDSSDSRQGHAKQPPNPEDDAIQDVDFADMDLNHQSEGTIRTRYLQSHPDLEDVVHENIKLCEPNNGSIQAWLKEVYRNARGFEIGTLNSSLLAVTMKRQAVKWRSLALGYIADVATMVHTFVVDLLLVVCPIERIRSGIMSLLIDGLLDQYKLAISHVKFLLEVELNGTPATLNHYFNDNLEKW